LKANIFSTALKNALVYFNAGVVVVNFEVVSLGRGCKNLQDNKYPNVQTYDSASVVGVLAVLRLAAVYFINHFWQ
jgi:hypothetical protein